jgi:hypothetical protein
MAGGSADRWGGYVGLLDHSIQQVSKMYQLVLGNRNAGTHYYLWVYRPALKEWIWFRAHLSKSQGGKWSMHRHVEQTIAKNLRHIIWVCYSWALHITWHNCTP